MQKVYLLFFLLLKCLDLVIDFLDFSTLLSTWLLHYVCLKEFCISGTSSWFLSSLIWLQIHADETKSTLQFASRALRVTNCAHVNEVLIYILVSFLLPLVSTQIFMLYISRPTFALRHCANPLAFSSKIKFFLVDINRCCSVKASEERDRGASSQIAGQTTYSFVVFLFSPLLIKSSDYLLFCFYVSGFSFRAFRGGDPQLEKYIIKGLQETLIWWFFLECTDLSWKFLFAFQIELERERMALELEEEKKVQSEWEKRVQEQAKKIENLSSMVLYSKRDENHDEIKKVHKIKMYCIHYSFVTTTFRFMPTGWFFCYLLGLWGYLSSFFCTIPSFFYYFKSHF